MKTKSEEILERLEALAGLAAERAERSPGLIRRAAGVTAKSLDVEARTVRVIASSEAIDSYDEIVVQDWDLSRYNNNAPVLYAHNAGGGFCGPATKDTFPVGYATHVEVVDGRLEATLNFIDEKASPLAGYVWEGIKQGSLSAVSVGFMPKNVEPGKRDGKDVYFLSGNELFEISVVPMGANPEAVAKMAARNAAIVRERAALTIRSRQAAPAAEKKQMEEIEKLKTELAARDAEIARLKEAGTNLVIEHGKRVTTLEKSVTDLTTERDSFKARAEKAEKAEIEHEVMALVGKKIVPAEKAHFIELRTVNKALFERMIADRPELTLTRTVTTDGSEPQESTVGQTGGASARLAAVAQKAG